MSAPIDKPAGPAAAISSLLGARCARTWLVGAQAAQAAAALDVPQEPVIRAALNQDGAPASTVRDLRAEKAALARGQLLTCDVSATGPYLCPAAMRGADVVIDDLSSLGPVAPGVSLCAVSLSRDAMGTPTSRAQEAFAASHPAPETAVAAVGQALQGFPERCQRRADTASALASYLACHPDVASVSYPGLKGDAAHGTAERVFEHGFGFSVAFVPAGSPAAVLAASKALAPAGEPEASAVPHVPTTLSPLPAVAAPAALLLVAGDEDSLALVMWLERLLDPLGEF
ncbi:PLP-dependent transferase [Atopobiaceae bacterium 24-176]